MTDQEVQKTQLEIKKLRGETGVLGTFSAHVWPMIATALTLVISIIALSLSLHAQSLQVAFQREQMAREAAQKHKDALSKAVELATDPTAKPDRRIAGIWQLNDFWGNEDDQVVVANVLAAELVLGDEYRFARCAAAEVIGNAEGREAHKGGHEEKSAIRMTNLLYGDRRFGPGLVIRQHLLLRSAQDSSSKPDPRASNRCLTALDATREAIRNNWGYLRDVELSGTDLSWIQLREADLAGANLVNAYLGNANFRCANLSNADLSGAEWRTADFQFTVVNGAKPPEFVAYAVTNGAFDQMTDEDWLTWRNNSFLVAEGRAVLRDSKGSRCGERDLAPGHGKGTITNFDTLSAVSRL